ncbi:hypothetical protein Q760_12250 [Cellulomonas cellasea DSM 20118]|uniref:Uncharacterized protein n=1 Tax=Cellulomonas cellasea DSM 20118 TaxID=1408250 RepID=A0A0A0B6Y3_9CELL|nr:hypothetical protein Q760_12250 [Cellulomonas cellasea DSM 20118]
MRERAPEIGRCGQPVRGERVPTSGPVLSGGGWTRGGRGGAPGVVR